MTVLVSSWRCALIGWYKELIAVYLISASYCLTDSWLRHRKCWAWGFFCCPVTVLYVAWLKCPVSLKPTLIWAEFRCSFINQLHHRCCWSRDWTCYTGIKLLPEKNLSQKKNEAEYFYCTELLLNIWWSDCGKSQLFREKVYWGVSCIWHVSTSNFFFFWTSGDLCLTCDQSVYDCIFWSDLYTFLLIDCVTERSKVNLKASAERHHYCRFGFFHPLFIPASLFYMPLQTS